MKVAHLRLQPGQLRLQLDRLKLLDRRMRLRGAGRANSLLEQQRLEQIILCNQPLVCRVKTLKVGLRFQRRRWCGRS
eukprot:scaffold4911_cov65-Phaeocystis_antarctica.AAC.5